MSRGSSRTPSSARWTKPSATTSPRSTASCGTFAPASPLLSRSEAKIAQLWCRPKRFFGPMTEGPSNFPCSQCGECCRRVHLLAETSSLDRGDGTCRHFDDDLKHCRIYQRRPDICRVDRQYELHYRSVTTWESFVEMNQAACKALQLASSASAPARMASYSTTATPPPDNTHPPTASPDSPSSAR